MLKTLSKKEKENALNEVRILASIEHPNIIAYKEWFLEESPSALCIIMEFADGGDLYQKIVEQKKKKKLFSEAEIWETFIQIVKGLNSLHHKQILHRDLKWANIFMNYDGTVKLGDLNVSKVAKMGLVYTQTGTPYYASPEVWQDKPYDNRSDIWSLGWVIYEMITLRPPFTASSMSELSNKVKKGSYTKIPSVYSRDLATVVETLLKVSPLMRPSCEQILHMPAVEEHLTDEETKEICKDLLNTIKIPRNFMLLQQKLPASQYENDKVDEKEEEDYEEDFETLERDIKQVPIIL
jgi:NIMA (never in mitosis gene a)-related kinase